MSAQQLGPAKARSPVALEEGGEIVGRRMISYRPQELLIDLLAAMLAGLRHVAVGAASPIPGAAALLARAREPGLRVSILGSEKHNPFTDGGRELFDCAAQGRIDAFFLGGGQIDGHADINLVGVGGYPRSRVRWPGTFGSAYLYFLVPRVILFREEHTARVLVRKVEFVSAPGSSPAEVHRPGGPYALVTGRCVFRFDAARRRFRLASLHPGHTVDEIARHTGFAYEVPAEVPKTPAPDAATLALIRGRIGAEIAETYPASAARVLGVGAA
ncbi:MAG TPA: CoA-transferase [Geminicoccaceae bacterium]|nr:CoA-transferase [Geminicoccaceae bacterium]